MVNVNDGLVTKTYFLLLGLLVLLLITVVKVVDIGPGVTQRNHRDTITTPLPGNCPNCDYPDCGGCGQKPQITLEPTVVITPLPTFGGTPEPATPDIPDPTQFPTVFPTFGIPTLSIPTAIPTVILPTIIPTLIPPTGIPVPTFELPVYGD